MLISQTLRLFLDSIGRREEYEFYLRKFQSGAAACFAVLVPDAESIQDSGDLMAFDLQFLQRLDLCPLVLLCGPDAAAHAASLSAHSPARILKYLSPNSSEERWRDALKQSLEDGKLALYLCPDMNIQEAVEALTPQVSQRVHLLRASGMIRSPDGQPQPLVTTRFTQGQPLLEEDQELLRMADHWLQKQPSLHISVSSPLYLLQEIFTVRGRGSILRRGSTLIETQNPQDVDFDRLLTLMDEAFGKSLRDPESLRNMSRFWLEKDYRGAALFEESPFGMYLSKFAVGTEARGEGLAQELWAAACTPCPALNWRSRRSNPVNQWYERQADGLHREGEWCVFWKGIPPKHLPAVIHSALERPSDFEEKT